MTVITENQHNIEIYDNIKYWDTKPILNKIYFEFFKVIASQLNRNINGEIVVFGNGIVNLKMIAPEEIYTDRFPINGLIEPKMIIS